MDIKTIAEAVKAVWNTLILMLAGVGAYHILQSRDMLMSFFPGK